MPYGEGGPRPQEEMIKPKEREISAENAQDYYDEKREEIREGNIEVKEGLRQLELINASLETETDMEERKKLNQEAENIWREIEVAQEKIFDANAALDTAHELGIEVPPESIDVDVSEFDEEKKPGMPPLERKKIQEKMWALVDELSTTEVEASMRDLQDMNALTAEKKDLLGQMRGEKDNDKLNTLADRIIEINKQLEEITNREHRDARRYEAIDELRRKLAA